ncbi:MAG: hypothetical protein K0S80_5260, partial [Neobacillus sp.]|nr:hypothetical protein [Neobacillus sp.]
MGILIGFNYAEAQKSDSAPNTEISNEIEETNVEELTTIPDPDTNSDELSTDNTDLSTDQAQIVSQVQDGKIVDVPHIQQMPELQRGCEVTSLAMLLQYAGVSVDKMTLASEITTIPFRDL